MAVGEHIVSVFNGAADKDAFEEITSISNALTHKLVYDAKTISLHELYRRVRNIRESGQNLEELDDIFNEVQKKLSPRLAMRTGNSGNCLSQKNIPSIGEINSNLPGD